MEKTAPFKNFGTSGGINQISAISRQISAFNIFILIADCYIKV